VRQRHLIELARQQGLLHACPLPAESPTVPVLTTEAQRFQVLSQLALGKTDNLQVSSTASVVCVDSELDEIQQAAVARALNTADVCLIEGKAGTGKSRVAAEIVTQAAARGLRVLLLAQNAAAVDRVLEMLMGREQIFALRSLGRDETLESLPAFAVGLTFAERSRVLRQRTVESARRTQLETQQRLQRHASERALWPRLLELCAQHGQCQEELAQLRRHAECLPAELENRVQAVLAEAGHPLSHENRPTSIDSHSHFLSQVTARHQEGQLRQATHTGAIAKLGQRRQELAGQLVEKTTQAATLRPLAEAKRRNRWWSLSWWRATFGGDVVGRYETLQKEVLAQQSASELCDQELAAAHAALQTEQRQMLEAIDQLRQTHLADQQASLGAQLQIVQEKARAIDHEWLRLTTQLPEPWLQPSALMGTAVTNARQLWEQRCAREEEKVRFLNQWLEYVEEFSATLAERLPRLANVVAATVRSLQDDAHFGDQQAGTHFDLLVLDEAHQVCEPDLLKVARRASRWVLIGEPTREQAERAPAAAVSSPGRANQAPRHLATRPVRATPPNLFRKLWTNLHCDPSASAYDWYRADNRLCCRLRLVSPQFAGYVETECVADRPDVELCIVTQPRQAPFLAEVRFPVRTPLREAKQYIYQQLQEVAVRTTAHQLHWRDNPDEVVLQLGPSAQQSDDVTLADGVIEKLELVKAAAGNPDGYLARTLALEFRRDHGWDLERARDWITKHLGWRDLGRTVILDRVHRMSCTLAAVVERLLYGPDRHPLENEESATAACSNSPGPAFEFIAVPSALDRRDRRNFGGGNRAATVGGAGLEQMVGPGKIPAGWPEEFRNWSVPGLANYPEAQAVVRKLEELVADRAFRHAAQAHRGGPFCPAIAVVALYPAQAELLRRLIRKSIKLTQSNLSIQVGATAAFRQSECLVCLVSLTRSQGSRAVAYGDSQEALPLALTRSRQRTILFGDPGQLARRGQWRGPLDHLDEAAAALEKRWVDQLLRYVQR
jgi:hypothetical protein